MRAFSIIAMRLLAVYLVVNPLMALASVLATVFETPDGLERWWIPFAASLMVPLLLGALLWFKAPGLARKLHRDEPADHAVTDAGLVRAGSFLIGVYLTAHQLGGVISRWQWGGGLDAGSLVALAMGLSLMLGASATAKLFDHFRRF